MARNGAGGLDWSRSYLDRALVKKNLQICILPSPLPTYGRSCPSILEPPGSPITNQPKWEEQVKALFLALLFEKTKIFYSFRSSPSHLHPAARQPSQAWPSLILLHPENKGIAFPTQYLCWVLILNFVFFFSLKY